MQIVRIQALPREGFPHRPRAGRFFPSGQPVAMEILEQEEDPTIDIQKVDGAGKAYVEKRPDPARMCRRVFEAMVMTDPVLRVLADGETTSELSEAAMAAARKQASDLASELTDTKAKLAAAVEALAKAKVRLAELSAAPVAVGDTETSEPHHDKGGKGGKGK
jgi:hypothetical protein